MSWSFSVLWYSHSARSWASEPRVLVKSCCNCVMHDNWSLITVFCRVTTCHSFSFVNVVSFTNNTNTLSTVSILSNLVLSAFVHDATQILSLLLSLWLFFVVVLLLLVDVVVVAIVIIMIIIISHDPYSNLFIQSNSDNDDILMSLCRHVHHNIITHYNCHACIRLTRSHNYKSSVELWADLGLQAGSLRVTSHKPSSRLQHPRLRLLAHKQFGNNVSQNFLQPVSFLSRSTAHFISKML